MPTAENAKIDGTRRRFVVCWILVTSALTASAAGSDPTLRGQWPGFRRGPAYAVRVQGDNAYVAVQRAGLMVVNTSNLARVGGCRTAGDALAVAVLGNYAYLADGEAGLQIINISTPADPQRAG